MRRSTIRWWAWVCLTIVAMAVAGMLGLYTALIEHDATRISLVIIAAYIATTAYLGWSTYQNDDMPLTPYIADVMERAGIFGTFCGMAIAFGALGHMDAAGAWKQELLLGVSTKFYCSLVGMAAAFMLRTQLKILDPRHEI